MFYIIYDKKSGQIDKMVDMPEFLKHLVSFNENQGVIESHEDINPALFEAENGKLVLRSTTP